jgi:hypothetical protein
MSGTALCRDRTRGGTRERSLEMEYKDFDLDGEKYKIGKKGAEIEVSKDGVVLTGEQKDIIVRKLNEIIQSDKNHEFSEKVTTYVKDYISGKNKDARQTTQSLGRGLFNYL